MNARYGRLRGGGKYLLANGKQYLLELVCIGKWLAVQVSEFLTNSEGFLMLAHLQVSCMCAVIRKDPGPVTKLSF